MLIKSTELDDNHHVLSTSSSHDTVIIATMMMLMMMTPFLRALPLQARGRRIAPLRLEAFPARGRRGAKPAAPSVARRRDRLGNGLTRIRDREAAQ